VPQRLPRGKISTRALKPVTVRFEDGAVSDSSGQNSARTSQNGTKKVHLIVFLCCSPSLSDTQNRSPAAVSSLDDHSSNSPFSNAQTCEKRHWQICRNVGGVQSTPRIKTSLAGSPRAFAMSSHSINLATGQSRL
jgi:hypothetical protein